MMDVTANGDWLTVYKYRSLGGEFGLANVENIILKNRMRWQSPLELNDPFECSPQLVFGTSAAQRTSYIRDVVERRLGSASRRERRTKVRSLSRKSVAAIERDQREHFRQMMADSAVTCFSQERDHPLMWAHYADEHRGVCFEFAEQGGTDPWVTLPVRYSEQRPVVDTTQLRSIETLRAIVLTKASVWEYEHEHRLISYRGGTGLRQFPPAILKSIIFGARITPENETHVRAMVASRSKPLRLNRAKLAKASYDIVIEPA